MKNRFFTFIITLFAFILLAPVSFARCSDSKPVGKPVILNVESGDKSITLRWQEVPDPVTYYLVQYGPSKETMEYGSPDIGGRGANSYTIGDLQNGVKYYFQIRAGNGCRPGNFSDTGEAVAGGINAAQNIQIPSNLSMYKKVLGASIVASDSPKKVATHGAMPISKTDPSPTKKACAFKCDGLQILLAQVILLSLFFYFVKRSSMINPILSVFIPILANALYFWTNGKCGVYNFFCKYFLPLSILTYVLMLVVQKYILIDKNRKNI